MAVAAIFGGGLIAPVADAGAPALLRIAGSSSAYVDVTLRAGMGLDYTRIALQAKGSLAGVYIEPLTGGPPEDGIGFLVPLKFRAKGLELHPLQLGRAEVDAENMGAPISLRAGRHRVHLLADGPVTITIPLVGPRAASLSLRPTRRSAVTASTIDMTPRAPAPEIGPVDADQPHAVPERAITVVALRQVWRNDGGHFIATSACLERPATRGICYQYGPLYEVEEQEETPGGDHYWVRAGYYYPDDVTPGNYVAAYSTILAEKAESVVAFVMSLRLTAGIS
ncbi:MAG TPA: hypothetical protein VNA30_05720 [Mycobacteriales bacterium]|nr:hypothetical protein [Mycobacteriales bacterium]